MQLGGVVTPHDGQCYLEQRGNVFEYTMAEQLVSQAAKISKFVTIDFMQDYPSVGQISYLLQKYHVIPVFAVEAAAQQFYSVSFIDKNCIISNAQLLMLVLLDFIEPCRSYGFCSCWNTSS